MARPEQTEKPTPKRIAETRSSGRVARSAEVAPALVFLAAVMILHFGFMYWLNNIYNLVQVSFSHIASHDEINIYSAGADFSAGFAPLAPLMLFIFAT